MSILTRERSNPGLGPFLPQLEANTCLMDADAWRGESTNDLNLFCPPFHGLANAVHFREPDKSCELCSHAAEQGCRCQQACKSICCKDDGWDWPDVPAGMAGELPNGTAKAVTRAVCTMAVLVGTQDRPP